MTCFFHVCEQIDFDSGSIYSGANEMCENMYGSSAKCSTYISIDGDVSDSFVK